MLVGASAAHAGKSVAASGALEVVENPRAVLFGSRRVLSGQSFVQRGFSAVEKGLRVRGVRGARVRGCEVRGCEGARCEGASRIDRVRRRESRLQRPLVHAAPARDESSDAAAKQQERRGLWHRRTLEPTRLLLAMGVWSTSRRGAMRARGAWRAMRGRSASGRTDPSYRPGSAAFRAGVPCRRRTSRWNSHWRRPRFRGPDRAGR